MPERPHMRRDRLRAPPRELPSRPEVAYPAFPEPPPFQAHPPAGPGRCVDCGDELLRSASSPRCWGCGRALCAACFWRHGLAPADHRCAGCAARTVASSASISGGRAGPVDPLTLEESAGSRR